MLKSAHGSLVRLRQLLGDVISMNYKGMWMPDSAKYRKMWEFGEESDDPQDLIYMASKSDVVVEANMLIVLVDQANGMLYSLIQSVARELSAVASRR